MKLLIKKIGNISILKNIRNYLKIKPVLFSIPNNNFSCYVSDCFAWRTDQITKHFLDFQIFLIYLRMKIIIIVKFIFIVRQINLLKSLN